MLERDQAKIERDQARRELDMMRAEQLQAEKVRENAANCESLKGSNNDSASSTCRRGLGPKSGW